MKKFLFTAFSICMFCLTSSTARSQGVDLHHYFDTEVGQQPMAIYEGHGDNAYWRNVFCGGVDANFNGEFDEGDQAPSWWRIPTPDVPTLIPGHSEKLRDFEFGSLGFVFRPAILIDEANRKATLFMCHNERVKSFDMADGTKLDDTVAAIPAVALAVDGESLFLAENPDGGSRVIVFNHKTKTGIDTIQTNINLIDIKLYKDGSRELLCILANGPYGEAQSSLEIAEKVEGKYQIIKRFEDIGDTPNHIAAGEGLIAVTVNMSHQVHVYEMPGMEKKFTVDIPTTGFGGPRETYVPMISSPMFVSTYGGKIYAIDQFNGKIIDSLSSASKNEGLLFDGFFLYACNNLQLDSYSPDSTVTVFSPPLSVGEDMRFHSAMIFPNPAAENASLLIEDPDLPAQDYKIKIFSAEGAEVAKYTARSDASGTMNFEIPLRNAGLAAGQYFVKVRAGVITQTLVLNVVR